jgi:hypothetical protein
MLKQNSHRLLAGMLLSTTLWLPGRAAADADLERPYQLQIVLHVAEHRLLTSVFRERVARELRDGMQAALGDLARVTVVTKHDRLKDVLERGLERGLDGWVERTGIKTHFVLIDYSGVQYEIQARQHDGITGRVSPAVRRDRTRDRDFVARAAALLIEHDFGLVGTVMSAPDGQGGVTVKLHAGGLGSLARWVHKDQVFEIVPPGSATALDWAFLQVEKPPTEERRDGICICRLWHRYRLGSIANCRCLMLGTTKAPLRIQFVQDRIVKDRAAGERSQLSRSPLNSTVGVDIRRTGFEGEKVTKLYKTSDAAGWINTAPDGDKGVFENLAFVSVVNGIASQPRIPVPIIDDRPILIPVQVGDDEGTLFAMDRSTWEQNVADSLRLQDSLLKELREILTATDGRARAIAKARGELQRTRDDLTSLLSQRDELKQEAAKKKLAFNPVSSDAKLKALKDGQGILEKFLGDQDAIDREENDPKKKELRNQIEQAKLFEKDLEIGKAIKIYENVIKAGFDTPDVRKRVEDLRKLWEPHDQKHADARGFIYRIWPTLDAAGLKAKLPDVKEAFEQCKRVRDTISARKLLNITEMHASKLEAELKKLQPRINIDDEKPFKLIEEVSKGLVELATSVNDFLAKVAASEEK